MERILVIGVGFIGGYLGEGLRALLGNDLHETVRGIKGHANGLDARARALGYPLSVGDTADVLRRMQPTVIVLSAPPSSVPSIAQDILAPHYAACRAAGTALPDLWSFAPNPGASALTAVLGDDFCCAKILPNIFRTVCGTDLTPLGVNYITPAHPWPTERLTILQTVLAPYGASAVLTDRDSLILLSGKITSHVCYECCYAMQDGAADAGFAVPLNDLGHALCAARLTLCPELPALGAFSDASLPAALRPFVLNFAAAWYNGLRAFTRSMPLSIASDAAAAIDARSFALNIFPIAFETRDELEQDTRNAATRGGVLECGIDYFEAHIAAPLRAETARVLTGGAPDAAFYDFLRSESEAVSRAAYERCLFLTAY